MHFSTTATLLLSTVVAACMGKPHHHWNAEPVKAVAAFAGMNDVTGSIHFVQDSPKSPTYIYANLTGLPAGEHGFHIHQFGDLTNGCLSTGPHYNPFGKTHGAPDNEERHVGDFGNIVANEDGTAFLNITSESVKLGGPFSVIGRGIVLHTGVDDLGVGGTPLSNTTGNAGDRLACAIIGLSSA